ncbi:MAG TPA: hypothetical protein VMN35_04795 [Gaiellaceae bacterium]|nr:hypothetical protein [Gaiellaceae bacterium]
MDRALGLLLLTVYIIGVVGLAAAITWAVVRIFPTRSDPDSPPDERTKQPPPSDAPAGGRLFRKAKRGAA